MKKMGLEKLAFIFLFGFLVSSARAADEGKPAPAFEAKLFNGEKFSLAKAQKQVVVIHFWATWCDACRSEMPLFDNFYKKHRAEGLQMIALSQDDKSDENKAIEMMKSYSYPGGFGREAVFKNYGRIWRLPLTFVIDRKGILQKDGWVLDHPMTADDIEKTLSPLLH